MIKPGSAELRQLFASFTHSTYRLETLQSYGLSGEDPALDAFLAGQPYVRPPGKVNWLNNIHRAVKIGATMRRAHIVREPLTPYLEFELTWAYAPNVEAGEDIRIIALAEDEPWPAGLPQEHDYWLIDDRLYDMEYARDQARSWIGVYPVDDPSRVAQAQAWRDQVLEMAVPWRTYIATRPQLAATVMAMG